MVKKILRGFGIFLGVLVIVVAGFYTKVYFSTQRRLNKTYAVNPTVLQIKNDSAMLAKGKRLSVVKGCNDCHGTDFAGKIIHEDVMLGRLTSSNLTRGQGGLPNDYSEKDWVLALKHGIRKDGKPLVFMPSHEFTLLSEDDMRSLISYLQQVPPVDKVLPKLEVGPLARILADIGDFPLVPAEKIDHNRMLVKSVKEEVSIEYGKYLSTSCQGCHKESMKGGEAVAPGFPIVADISSSGNPGKWSDEQFIQTLRTGVTPEGKVLNPDEMPWPMAKELTDTELKALHKYLVSL
jgi:cytochrome c553